MYPKLSENKLEELQFNGLVKRKTLQFGALIFPGCFQLSSSSAVTPKAIQA